MGSDSNTGVTVHHKVEKSPFDQLIYRSICLPNGLEVLIASDPSSAKAAASLDVAVGHFSDPNNLPGLAHFLEHMLFLGTEKYPNEDSYNQYLSENGGQSNAYTAQEHTNYHFEMIISDKNCENVNGKMPPFKEALDRFSQFFKAPLFTETAAERELNAVHSEHQQNLQSDSRRNYQVQSTLSNPEHPKSKFSTGCLETLRTIPETEGIDTRSALLDFHRTYYSANLMRLCIIGPHSLDVMQEWVCELFSEVKNNACEQPCKAYSHITPLRKEDSGLMILVEPIKDLRSIEMGWITPWIPQSHRTKAGKFVGELLGDESEGSLLSLLKKNGWCDSLSSGAVEHMTFHEFVVQISLTLEGVDHVEEVICLVYQYIRLIKEKGVTRTYYEEASTLAVNAFKFHEKGEPLSFVSSTSSWMHYLQPKEYLEGPFLYREFDSKLIHEVLNCLTPEGANITVTGKCVSGKTNTKERWYGTPYSVEKIGEEKLKKFSCGPCDSRLCLPKPNPFIPSEFDLLATPLPEGVRDREPPKLVLSTEHMEVYHKLDRTFKRPKTCVFITIHTPVSYRSALEVALTHLVTFLIEDALMEYSYPAQKAGFDYDVDMLMCGVEVSVKGYSHRIDVLLKAIFSKISSMIIDPVRYDMQKDLLKRSYQNFAKAQPYSRAMYNISCLLEDPRWHVNDCLDALNEGRVTIQRLESHAKELWGRARVTALVNGNVLEDQAIAMAKSVQSILKYDPAKEYEQVKRRVVHLPIDKDIVFRMKHSNPEDKNSAIEVFFQTGAIGNFEHDMKLVLLSEILNKPCFHDLRTIQQLGYMVFEGHRNFANVAGLFIIVQSTVANPDKLLDRIDDFLEKARKGELGAISQTRFDQYKKALSTAKAQPETSLNHQSCAYWQEIMNGSNEFDRDFKEIDALTTIQKEDVIDFFDTFIAPNGKERRRVVSQVYGNEHPYGERRKLAGNAIDVHDPYAFRRSFPLYPISGKHNFSVSENYSPTVENGTVTCKFSSN